jgi:hypothetical protein
LVLRRDALTSRLRREAAAMSLDQGERNAINRLERQHMFSRNKEHWLRGVEDMSAYERGNLTLV